MREKNIWNATRSLLVVFNYEDDEQLNGFRKSLDKMLNVSNVDRLIIVVNIAKEVDKNTLPPHFLIYYNSPNDYSFWGKMKDVQLESELKRDYDVMIWFGNVDQPIFKEIKNTNCKRRIVVNENNDHFDLQLNAESSEPSEMLNFVIHTLEKISIYE
ncbi:MAG: hypothetical protein ACKO7P_10630 [Bacteroidota bacterium]